MKEIVDFKVYALNYDRHRKADIKLVETAIDSLSLDKTAKILDFGCGTGNYIKEFEIKGYNNLFGLDQSVEMCKMASEKTSAIIENGSHIKIPFEDDFFDTIIIVDVVHFIEDLHSLFNGLERICKENGRIFIATQSHAQIEARIYSKYFPSTTKIDKLRHHDINKIINVAESCGFTLLEVVGYLNDTDYLVDEKYFNLIKHKSFYILGLLSEYEFNEGIEKLKNDLKNGNYIAKFPGRTLITLEKK
jgi:ubiquinone/menaquinone biosynthesis C-methylase UbiE